MRLPIKPLLLWALLVAPCVFVCLPVPTVLAEDPPPAPTVADLERRIRELEEIVHRLEAERRKDSAAPTPAPTAAPYPELGAPPAGPESAANAPRSPAELLQGDGSAADGAAEKSSDGSSGKSSDSSSGKSTDGSSGKSSDSSSGKSTDGSSGKSGGTESKGPSAGWEEDRGFFLRSKDRFFNLRITGQVQGDYRAFLDGRDYVDEDTFLVRRARLGIEADVGKYYEFRLLPDFSNSQAPGVPGQTRIQDAYMNIHYWDPFQIEVGKFKQPFSYEQLIQDRFVPTLERSLIDQFVPARDEGVMLHGYKLLGGRFDYGFAVSNGEINGDFDTNKQKDVNGRLVFRPFLESPWLCGLQLGISAGTGVEQENIMPNPLRMPDTVPWLTFNSTVRANGLRDRYSPEVSYFHGPLGLAAQYYREEQRMSPVLFGPGAQFDINVPITGYYVLGTYLVTGEERTTYSMPIKPLRPFDPCHPLTGPGAWELVGRLSRVNLGDEVFEPLPVSDTKVIRLADPKVWTRGVTEMTLGFNWYLTAWVRLQFNWEHDWFDSPVRLGPGPAGLLRHQDALLTRLQVIF